jgi:hypothetical protein
MPSFTHVQQAVEAADKKSFQDYARDLQKPAPKKAAAPKAAEPKAK